MGTVSGSGSVNAGSDREISATPNAGYRFTQWNDGNQDNPRTLTNVQAAATYTAYFEAGMSYVDLGLPSGAKWADMNLGASSETDAGGFYSFGETSTKANYAENQYSFSWNTANNYETMDGEQMLKDAYDAATSALGSGWRVPTKAEIQELKDNCTVTSVTGGWRFTSKNNGNSIVIPKSGYKTGSGGATSTSDGYVWSRTMHTNSYQLYNSYSYYMNLYSTSGVLVTDASGKPSNGMTIRPIYVPSGTKVTATFNYEDNSLYDTKQVDKYSQPSVTAPTKASTNTQTFAFSGWSPALGKISVPTTYTASFSASTRYYTVNFTTSNATLSKYSGSYTYNGAITDVTVTPNAGYVFDHWENAGGTPVNLNSITKTDNMTLTAVCVPQFDNDDATDDWADANNWYNNTLPTSSTNVTLVDDVTVGSGTQQVRNLTLKSDLTVASGAILVINGDLSVDAGHYLIIEPNAIVKANGEIPDNKLVLQSSAAGNAQLILPTSGTIQPYATVQLYTGAKKEGSVYTWQHFGVPTTGTGAAWTRSQAVDTWVYNWDPQDQWANAEYASASELFATPFQGHNLTNVSDGGVVYTFTGQTVGNIASAFDFVKKGWNHLANSYTASVSLENILNAMPSDVEASVYTYDGGMMHQATLGEIEGGEATVTNLKPMQAFFLHATAEGVGQQDLSYGTIVVDPTVANAPRRMVAPDYTGRVFITATSNSGVADQVKLREASEWSSSVWNNMDGSKLIANGHGIYAINNGRLAAFATDNLVGTTLGFTAGTDSEYTLTFSNILGEAYTLLDNQTGARVEMKAGESYTFNAEPKSVNEARFIIVERRNTPTALDEVETLQGVQKFVENGNVIILKDGVRYNVLGTQMQ